jgi:hypothetical protein
MLKPPREYHIAQENNLNTVLTAMSAGCPGGLEVSTADQYSQDLRFKPNSKSHLHVKDFSNRMMKINTSFSFLRWRTTRSTRVCALQRTCIESMPANIARFEIVHNKDFNSRQLHALLLMRACCFISIRNSELHEHLKAILCTINCSYSSFQALIFAHKYIFLSCRI